jgi:hypothetical protein
VTESLSNAELRRAASDPTTQQATLADLAYDHPDLRVAIALNPSTYEGLLEWLSELDDGAVTAALAQRSTGEPAGTITEKAATPIEPAVGSGSETDSLPPATIPGPTAVSAGPEMPSVRAPRTSRRLKASLIAGAAVVVIVGLVLGGLYAYSSFVQPHGTVSAAGTLASATDYRFGAKQTWQTKVKVVASASDGFAYGYASVQTYPGLWLVSWPGDDSGSGRLADETVLAMDPDTGAVKWSMSPGPFDCASSLAAGALACVDTSKASLAILNPSTGKATDSSLNGFQANSVNTYGGDILVGYEAPNVSGSPVLDTIERIKLDGTVVWKKTASCAGDSSDDGMQFATADQLSAAVISGSNVKPDSALLEGVCLQGSINLDSGAINPDPSTGEDGCLQSSPFNDTDGTYAYGDPCVSKQYPMLVPRGVSTLTAITESAYASGDNGSNVLTVWSADLTGARFSVDGSLADAVAHLGSYALVTSAGHLYGVDTERGPTWEQSSAFSGDGHVQLLRIDTKKANTPVLALDADHDTIERLDPGFGAARVTAEPASLPSCPEGQTPVSFSTWDSGKGATLVCQGFTHTVTVFLIVGGKTYTSANGSITATGYRAEFASGVSVDIGLGGWAAWVGDGGRTTLHAASNGWQIGDAHVRAFPALSNDVEACPADTYPLSLSTWHGGWLLTCGEKATATTRFIYVDGSAHGGGHAMTTQGGQSCGTDSAGLQVCVSASPAVVTFSPKGGSQKQHSVDANYVAGKGFSGAGQGTGAYGLADPQANAASEVAYLNGILQQSQAARSNVKSVVQNILKCASVQADVQSAQAVVADRTTELQALNSAPVDAVSGGSALVAQLQAVLQDSLTADQAYVTAAGQVAGGQCAAGISTYNAQKPLIAQITNEKTAFTNAWNGQIASAFGTPTYTQDDI